MSLRSRLGLQHPFAGLRRGVGMPDISDLLRGLTVQPVSDAYWSATHPRDRIMGRGRSSNQQMVFPFLRRVEPGGEYLGYRGTQKKLSDFPMPLGEDLVYNLYDREAGHIGSLSYVLPDLRGEKIFADEIFIRPEHRNLKNLHRLLSPMIRDADTHGIEATFANAKLEAIFHKLLERRGKIGKLPEEKVAKRRLAKRKYGRKLQEKAEHRRMEEFKKKYPTFASSTGPARERPRIARRYE